MKTLWDREPAALVGFVHAALLLLVAFGVHVSAAQIAAVEAFVVAGSALVVRRKVTPTS